MNYLPGDSVHFSFETRAAGVPTAADAPPALHVDKDGVDDTASWADLAIAADASGDFLDAGGNPFVYRVSATVPAGYTGRHDVEFRALAAVGGNSDSRVVKAIQIGKSAASVAGGDSADAAKCLRWLRFLGRSDPPSIGAADDYNAADGDYPQAGSYDPTKHSNQAKAANINVTTETTVIRSE